MTINVILQARCSSSRLPGKVMKKLLGKPMIQHQIERVRKSAKIDKLVLATSQDDSDIPLIELCKKIGVEVFAGDLDNVLARFFHAAQMNQSEHIIRLTGDCPLIDYKIIDKVIVKHLVEDNDYTSNIEIESFPDGLDVEVFKYAVLEETYANAFVKSDLEHVTPYIRKNPSVKKGVLVSNVDLSNHRWTVDEQADFEFVTEIYKSLYKSSGYFGLTEVMALLEKKPEISQINANINRNEGYTKSLNED